jgi:hypothetical protein
MSDRKSIAQNQECRLGSFTSYDQCRSFGTELGDIQAVASVRVLCLLHKGEDIFAIFLGWLQSFTQNLSNEHDEHVSCLQCLWKEKWLEFPAAKLWSLDKNTESNVRLFNCCHSITVLWVADCIKASTEQYIRHNIEGKMVNCQGSIAQSVSADKIYYSQQWPMSFESLHSREDLSVSCGTSTMVSLS